MEPAHRLDREHIAAAQDLTNLGRPEPTGYWLFFCGPKDLIVQTRGSRFAGRQARKVQR
jgi:hypothetical protein